MKHLNWKCRIKLPQKKEDNVIAIELEDTENENSKTENESNDTEENCSQFDESELEDLDIDEVDFIKYGFSISKNFFLVLFIFQLYLQT